MRIIIDLQACQFLSRFRGIGRYSMSLAQNMACQLTQDKHEVWILLSDKFPETITAISAEFAAWIPSNRIAVFSTPNNISNSKPENEWRVIVSEKARARYIEQLKPDFVHLASVVEGWLDESVTSVNERDVSHKTAVTLYDLIPLVLQDIYLAAPEYKKFYLRKIESIKNSDILFAISESSRQEAISLLGCAPEKVINISTAVDAKFKVHRYSATERHAVLREYKILKEFVLYAPGGFDPRKNFDRLIQAFSELPTSTLNRYQLVICSKLHGGEKDLMESIIGSHGLDEQQVILTDYVSDVDLVALYNLCALKVFPSLHEGFGLPVLEAMSCGAAVIGSNTTSIPEVIGCEEALFDPYSVPSITEKINLALCDTVFNAMLKAHGLGQSHRFSWGRSAALAISALERNNKAISKDKIGIAPYTSDIFAQVAEEIEAIHSQYSPSASDTKQLRDSITRNETRLRGKQLLVDISELVRSDAKTGIQRVVRSILLQLFNSPPDGFFVSPIYSNQGGTFHYANSFVKNFRPLSGDMGNDLKIEFSRGDVFLGLDLSAHLFPALDNQLDEMKRYGVSINYVVYDLTPLTHPQWHVPGMNLAFKQWISSLATYADNLICISQSVANDVKFWLGKNFPEQSKGVKLSYFHLGADISSSAPSLGIPTTANQVLCAMQSRRSFLAVGSIEPRKGYSQLIAAFELLWDEGVDVNLIIVGKAGWQVDGIIKKLSSHAQLNAKLFWLTGVSDEYLERIYGAASCLIACSEAEGFGLPLIEAAQHNIPIIARDILVFREVASRHAFYFDGTTGEALAVRIKEWLQLFSLNNHPTSNGMPWLTWAQSARDLMARITSSQPSSEISTTHFSSFSEDRFIRTELPLAEHGAAYQVGEVIDFSIHGNGKIYALDGWSHAEDWGCWTTGNVANLAFRVVNSSGKPLCLKLILKAFVNDKHRSQKFELAVNNRVIASLILSEQNNQGQSHEIAIDLPVELLSIDGDLELQFVVPDANSPLNLGMSPDNRALGVGVSSLQIV